MNWWIAVLFAIGSVCFVVGPFPGYVQLVGSGADGITFFVGSLFFISAALLQALSSEDRGPATIVPTSRAGSSWRASRVIQIDSRWSSSVHWASNVVLP